MPHKRCPSRFKLLSELAREEGGVPCKSCRSLYTVNGGLICARCLWLRSVRSRHVPKTPAKGRICQCCEEVELTAEEHGFCSPCVAEMAETKAKISWWSGRRITNARGNDMELWHGTPRRVVDDRQAYRKVIRLGNISRFEGCCRECRRVRWRTKYSNGQRLLKIPTSSVIGISPGRS